MAVTDLEQFSKNVNETVAETLSGSNSLEKYSQLHNSSLYQGNLLQPMSQKLNASRGRTKRSIKPLCNLRWEIDYKVTRHPSIIRKAVCNGEGKTCLCKEVMTTLKVRIFLGQDKNGKNHWQNRAEEVPTDCSCSQN